MTRYKLINEGYGKTLINELAAHLEVKENIYKKHGDVEYDRCPLHYFKGAIYIIKKYQLDNPSEGLNNFISDEYLTLTEATLLLNGLNPAAGNDIDSEDELVPRGGDDCSYDILSDYLYENNKEYRQLSKAVKAKDGFATEENSEILIYTEAFIPWAIGKGFIEEINNVDDQESTTEKYVTWQKNHNTVIALTGLEKYRLDEKVSNKPEKTVSSLLSHENTAFYKSIKDQLVSKNEKTHELPKAKTLKNYISNHNAFSKSLDKD
jgi:hypothetical protein